MPRVSVIIPTRNRLGFLKEALGSVLVQAYENYEALVVDDASEDGTWAWLRSLSDERIRAFRQPERQERSAARNLGLREAHGEFVLFLDDDDRLAGGALEKLVAETGRHPRAIAVVGAQVSFDERGHSRRCPHPRRVHLRLIWPDVLLWHPQGGQALIRRDAVIRAGGYNDRLAYAEDGALWLRLARLGPVLLIPDKILEYRLHAGQTAPPAVWRGGEPTLLDFIQGLPPEEQTLARRILSARRAAFAGRRVFLRGDHRKALACYLRAIRTGPALLRSPLVGGELARATLKSFAGVIFGRRFIFGARQLMASFRLWLGRAPGSRLEAGVGRRVAGWKGK